MAWSISADPDRFEEAIEAFARRFPVTPELLDALREFAGPRAWTISGVAQLDILLDVYETLLEAIANGTPLQEFKAAVTTKLETAWGRPIKGRVELIFRNATQTSYNRGRWRQITDPDVLAVRPYLMFDAILDSRTCFAADTPVRTPGGDVPIARIAVGDTVISCRGRERKVVATSVLQTRTWGRIALSNGREFRCTPDHPILTDRGWVAAKRLGSGDRVVLGSGSLCDMWEDVPANAQPEQVLLRCLPTVQDAAQGLPRLRRGLPANIEARPASVLLGAVQGSAKESPLSRLWQHVSTEHSAQATVRGVPNVGVPMRAMWAAVQRNTDRGGARATPLLQPELCEGSAARKEPQPSHGEGVLPMRPDIRRAARDEALLYRVPEAAGVEVHTLWGRRARGEQALLQRELLSPVPRRDVARNRSEGSAGEQPDSIRAGGQDRPLVGGLPGSKSVRAGGRRRLLAPDRIGSESGRAPRPGDYPSRVCRAPSVGTGDQEGSALRDPELARLWPVPLIGSAAETATVVCAHWQLTASSEPAYDIQVEDDAGFIASGVVVHNSPICNALSQPKPVTRPASDPFWLSHQPPLHHNCRSSLRSLTEAQAKRRGITESTPTTAPQAGFGGVDPEWQPDPSHYPPELWQIYAAKAAAR